MSKLDPLFNEYFSSPDAQKLLKKQIDCDLLDAMVDSDYVFDQESRLKVLADMMMLNKHLIKGKTVLNIHPKLLVLAFAAVHCGAAKVIVIDNTNITSYLEELIRKNNMKGKVEIVRKSLAEAQIDKVDVLVADCISSFGISKGLMADLIQARDLYLKQDGLVS